MKVLTLNVWGTHGPAERQGVLLEALKELSPDILCLQEVTDEALLERLSYPTKLHFEGSELAVLSRFPVREQRLITFRAVSPLEPYRRQAQMARLDTGETPLWIVTTHLAWQKEDDSTRIAQVEELLKETSSLGASVLVSGDLNAEPDHPPIRRLREAGFLDLFSASHPKDPGITWDNRNPFIQSHSVRFPDRRIDYLFLRQEALSIFPCIGCKIVCGAATSEGLYPSDHYGVLATFAAVPTFFPRGFPRR